MFETITGIQDALAEQRYIATDNIATTLFLAERLGKPVLAEGPAGVGKTELAKAWALAAGRELIRLQCYEGLDETKALYEWEYAKQMLYTQLLREKLHDLLADTGTLGEAADRLAAEEDVFFSMRFLLQRPLLRAILAEEPTLLLIDEIDRCIVEGTLVMTLRGPVPVEELQAGDPLVGFDPATFSRTTVTLQKVHRQQAATILQIIVGGRLLLVTPEHRFVRFTDDGQYQVVQACALQVGDMLPIDRTVPLAPSAFTLPAFGDELVKINDAGKILLNQRLRECRLTQQEAADLVGVSRSHLRNVIAPASFRKSLRANVLEKLCDITGEDFGRFFERHAHGLRPQRCPELFELLGYICGDGCYTGDRLTIADKDRDLLATYATKFERAFSASPSITPGPHRNFELEYHSLPLGRWLDHMLGSAVNHSRQRRLPAWVWSLAPAEQRALLRGLFDAEGWVGPHFIGFASASWRLIVDVQLLLTLHDIEARIAWKSPSEDGFGSKGTYSLQITDVKGFTARVNFNSRAKRQKLGRIQAPRFHKGDFLPAHLVRPELERLRAGRTLHVLPHHQSLYDLLAGRIRMNRDTIMRLAEALEDEPLHRLTAAQLSLGQITTITVVEEPTQVYDLTVSGPEYFVANGVVTHNSDTEFEAFLLEVLSDFQVSVPELGTLVANQMPFVVLTSNNTRELSEALKRRCLYIYLDYPDPEAELRIVRLRVPDLAPELARQAVEVVQRLRQLDLKKAPSVSETLDWARALVAMNAASLDRQTLDNTLTVLLKHEADLRRARRAIGWDPEEMEERRGLGRRRGWNSGS